MENSEELYLVEREIESEIDCRYCHSTVEVSAKANIPPTQTCMNCHKMVMPESEKLAPVRESYATKVPIQWVRIHKVPDYAFFNHAAHLRAGVSCISCHGNVAQMEVVMQKQPLSMGWCVNCHRDANARGVHGKPVYASIDCVSCHY